jgi:hypothetical protein
MMPDLPSLWTSSCQPPGKRRARSAGHCRIIFPHKRRYHCTYWNVCRPRCRCRPGAAAEPFSRQQVTNRGPPRVWHAMHRISAQERLGRSLRSDNEAHSGIRAYTGPAAGRAGVCGILRKARYPTLRQRPGCPSVTGTLRTPVRNAHLTGGDIAATHDSRQGNPA